jgi:hypothetical protein
MGTKMGGSEVVMGTKMGGSEVVMGTKMGGSEVVMGTKMGGSEVVNTERTFLKNKKLVLKFEIYEDENTKHFKFENSKTSGFLRNFGNCSSKGTALHFRRLMCSAIPL